ncbi:MAG: hypothetical protein NZ743_00695, partial [Pseudomonadales bacterium]|nr:hypothetical protein [Pseudomonadales bacterium]
MPRNALTSCHLVLLTLIGACGGGSGGNSAQTSEISVAASTDTSMTQTPDECLGSGVQLDCPFNHDGLVR